LDANRGLRVEVLRSPRFAEAAEVQDCAYAPHGLGLAGNSIEAILPGILQIPVAAYHAPGIAPLLCSRRLPCIATTIGQQV